MKCLYAYIYFCDSLCAAAELSHINCKISHTSDLNFPRRGNYHHWCDIHLDLCEAGLLQEFLLLLRFNLIYGKPFTQILDARRKVKAQTKLRRGFSCCFDQAPNSQNVQGQDSVRRIKSLLHGTRKGRLKVRLPLDRPTLL